MISSMHTMLLFSFYFYDYCIFWFQLNKGIYLLDRYRYVIVVKTCKFFRKMLPTFFKTNIYKFFQHFQ